MRRPRIKTALVGDFVGIGVIVGDFSWFSLTELKFINRQVLEIAQDWLPSVQLTKEMDTVLSDIRLSYASHITASTDAEQAEAEQLIIFEEKRFLDVIAQYEELVTEYEKPITKHIRSNLEKYASAANAMLTASRNDDDVAAKRLLSGEMLPSSKEMATLIDQLTAISINGAQGAYESSQSAYKGTLWTTIFVMAACFLAMVSAAWFALAGVARPIERMTVAIRNLSAGDNASAIPYAGRADEIGDIVTSVEVFEPTRSPKSALKLKARPSAMKSKLPDRGTKFWTGSARKPWCRRPTGLAKG